MRQMLMSKNNFIKNSSLQLSRVFVLLISFISTLYVDYNVSHLGYDKLHLLPFVFGIVYVVFISTVLFKNTNIFLIVFTAVSFTRYVILPTLIVYTNLYGGRSTVPPLNSSLETGLSLMIYELVVVSLVIFFLFRNYKPDLGTNRLILPNGYFIYIIFILMTLFLVILTPSALNSFYIIVPPEGLGSIDGGGLYSLTVYCLIISKFFIYLILMSFLYKKFLLSQSRFYILLSLIVTVLNISLVFGANRADFIITSIVSILLFNKLYPKQGKFVSVFFVIMMVIILSFINSYRDHNTYSDGANPLMDLTATLQVYLGGPYNVAIAVETAELNPEGRDLLHFGYDLLRPTIGPNIILQNVDYKMTSDYFNERIFFSDHKSQIIPIIGQGYFFFGFFLSPIILLSFVLLVRILLHLRQNISKIELYFFLSIPIARIGLAMGQNGSILMNDTSYFLTLSLIVYYLNNKIVLTKKNSKEIGPLSTF